MAMTQGELIFARHLDEQLQKIQEENNLYPIIHNDLTPKNFKTKNIKMNNINRPQFMTTVKKGSFLEPPPEVAVLWGLSPSKSPATSPQSSSGASVTSNSTAQAPTVIMYSYASKPKVLNKNYHTDCARNMLNNAREGAAPYGNLMYDRRVVRGSTYATHNVTSDDLEARQREAHRRAQARRKARVYSSRGRQGTPPPVPGRKHEPVQTERFLEELLDRPPESEVACQTDLFLDRPDTPPFLSSSYGEDKETQIYPGELFDFDTEVIPILDNLVTRALEQGLTEVLEEEEIYDLQVQQRRLQEIRALEEMQQERLDEDDFKLLQDDEITKEVPKTLAEMITTILSKLRNEGCVVRPQDEDLSWLLDTITSRLTHPDVIEDMVREILQETGRLYKDTEEFGAETLSPLSGDIDNMNFSQSSAGEDASDRSADLLPVQLHSRQVRKMSAFSPYKRAAECQQSIIQISDLQAMIQMYTAAVFTCGLKSDVHTRNYGNNQPPDKSSKFLIKNILKEEERKPEASADPSRLETLVSSLGRSENGHRCIYCGKIYSRKYGLKIHIRTHTGYKPLRCKFCLRPFGDPSNLNKHVRLHAEGTTPYRCEICGKILVRKRDLDRHILSRHPVKDEISKDCEDVVNCTVNKTI